MLVVNNAVRTSGSSLLDNHTWDIVPCSVGVKFIACKWLCTLKLHDDGSIERHKAHLLALRNWQKYRLDYKEMSASVAKMTISRTVMAIVVSKEWSLSRIDVKNVFLRGI